MSDVNISSSFTSWDGPDTTHKVVTSTNVSIRNGMARNGSIEELDLSAEASVDVATVHFHIDDLADGEDYYSLFTPEENAMMDIYLKLAIFNISDGLSQVDMNMDGMDPSDVELMDLQEERDRLVQLAEEAEDLLSQRITENLDPSIKNDVSFSNSLNRTQIGNMSPADIAEVQIVDAHISIADQRIERLISNGVLPQGIDYFSLNGVSQTDLDMLEKEGVPSDAIEIIVERNNSIARGEELIGPKIQ